jgi:hypothetical protein
MDAKLFKIYLVELQKKARATYDAFENPMWCKALNAQIFFNARGFHHLLYDGLGNKRSPTETGRLYFGVL